MEQVSNVHDTRKLDQLISQVSGKPSTLSDSVRDVNDGFTTDNSAKVERWHPIHPALALLSSRVSSLSNYAVSCDPPSEEDVADVIRKLRNNKAPGEGAIPAEIYKSCVDTLAHWLDEVIEQVWRNEVAPGDWGLGILVPILKKGGKRRCENCRDISLLDVAAKSFAIILLKRFQTVRDSGTRPNQAEFRAGRRCADQVFTLRPTLKFRHNYQQPTAFRFVDFVAAFDSVHRESLWRIMTLDGVPAIIIAMIKAYYFSTTARVLVRNNLSQPFGIRRRLTTFSCKEQRTGHLQAELAKLNINLPARVWLPVERTDHIILRIPPSAAVCLNSAEKAPYLLFVEVLACDSITSLRLPPRTGSFSGLAPSNIPNHAFHDTHLFTSPLLSSSKPAELQGAPATTYPDLISLFSADSGSCSGGSAGDEFSTGPNALWSTTNSAYRTPPSSSSSCSSSSARCAVKPTTPVVDRPRTHPPSDHHLYCIKAVEIRRRLEENTACQPQRSFKLDPKDPSAAVLKEPLELKARRIQESSPWGHLPGWQLAAVIVKVGDDLRQEQLAYQLLTVLQKIWAQNLLKLWLRPLNIVVTSCDTGLIELVPDTVSLHQIRRHTRLSLRDYIIREHGPPNSEGFLTAQTNFVRSCAAYCLVGYLFQVKDRHNGNILIDKEGHVIHIDYGFMLSASPGKNLGFETSPFKLTSEQVDLMGGVDNDMFQYYKILILHGLLAARKHMEELCLLVEIARMGHPHLPCFSKGGGAGAIAALRQRFLLTRTEESLQAFVSNMVEASLHSLTTPLYDSYQYYTNGIQ
nr:unnamed protein product [Spirometra erinaceieuropaei]